MPDDARTVPSAAHFARPQGPRLLDRTGELAEWFLDRVESETWPYLRSMRTGARPRGIVQDVTGRAFEGINFTSQDYLGLATHPEIVAAAVDAARHYGVHSGGSGMMTGGSPASLALEAEIGELVQLEHVLLYPTGWAAGYGAITGLVRPYDHVLLDERAHACLQQGAAAATRHVRRHPHLDHETLAQQLAEIRAADSGCGILVVTEGLYSMDADTPDLRRYVELAHEYDATLMVDQAHDLGASGPGGTGQVGLAGLTGQVDLVMGAFSKTFASNGGFIATNSHAARAFLTVYSGPYTFSNALSPVQVATVRAALRFARSEQGERRRTHLHDLSSTLRTELAARGQTCPGVPSAVNPVMIGSETTAWAAMTMLNDRGVLANFAEFPAVPIGAARLRLQLMATHTLDQVRTAARTIAETIDEARNLSADPAGRAPLPAAVTGLKSAGMPPLKRRDLVA